MMILARYKHYNIDTRKISPGKAEKKAYKFIESINLESDYIEVDNILEINNSGFDLEYDYKFVRDVIKNVVLLKGNGDEELGFNSLSNNDKLICCEHKIGTHEQRLAVVGATELVALGANYNAKTLEVRRKRAVFIESEVHNRLPKDKFLVFYAAQTVFSNYINYGVEGTEQGDIVGITDYFNGLNDFQGNGLIDQTYNVEGNLTIQQFVTRLEDILLRGKING